MPGRVCAVATCKNNQLSLRKKGSKIIFHCFPRGNDSVSTTMRKQWVHRCKRANKFNVDKSAVCSDHFKPDDYERDLQNELLNLPLRKILKKTAVPTLNLGEKNDRKTTELKPREKRAIRRKNKEIVDALLLASTSEVNQPLPSTSKKDFGIEGSIDETSKIFTIILTAPNAGTKETIPSKLQTEPRKLFNYKKKYKKLMQKYNEFKTKSNKKIRRLNMMLTYYENKYGNRAKTNTDKSLKKQNQTNLLSHNKLIQWTWEELSAACTLMYYSKKCYLYFRNSLNYPLPSLKQWESA